MQSRDDESWLQKYENGFGNNVKYLPQYKYFTRPLYKLLGGDQDPLFSVPATFAITDFVIHQLLYNIIKDSLTGELSVNTLFKFNISQFLFWTSLSLPIAYHKQNNPVNTAAPQPKQDIHQSPHTLFAAPNHKHRKTHKKKARGISANEMARSSFGSR